MFGSTLIQELVEFLMLCIFFGLVTRLGWSGHVVNKTGS